MSEETTLLALSDLMVLTALERAFSRAKPQGQRGHIAAAARHRAYESVPIPVDRIDYLLRDAWALCPLLSARYALDVDPVAWAELLGSYTATLLMACQHHSKHELRAQLAAFMASSPDEEMADA